MTALSLPWISAIFAILAGLIHCYFWFLESVRWRQPAAWQRFGVKNQDEADTLAEMAFNQGYYNLVIGIGSIVGAVLLFTGVPALMLFAAGLVVMACATMVVAAVILLISKPGFLVPVLIQGVAPIIALFGFFMMHAV
ncbi:DUF1304 domain-containing protein [Psychromicrobium lacuslunae]|uniref:Epimerase n=1 Tax=Psychromicrobium lacuslunae TaxID=1618207 RepID=A0A0D4BXR7_9MICC|nr:DUF1304 domain-containing protein [Psychromicrobium lacuslunae]AJT41108.1 hypothetical protein UM93_05495 [Psychromicrobium lacuslunae]